MKLIVADFAQIELRVNAWLSRERKLMEMLANDGDPYSDFATQVYKRPVSKSKETEKERKFGKEAVLGLGYGMGAKKFRVRVRVKVGQNITMEQSSETVDLFRDYYNPIPEYWDVLDRFILHMARGSALTVPGAPFLKVEKARIILPSGLVLQYPNLREMEIAYRTKNGEMKTRVEWVFDDADEMAKAGRQGKPYEPSKLWGGTLLENICQAVAGNICTTAIQRVLDAGLMPAGQNHDELLVPCEDDAVEQSIEIVREAMERPISWFPSLKLKAEIGVGQNWSEAKP